MSNERKEMKDGASADKIDAKQEGTIIFQRMQPEQGYAILKQAAEEYKQNFLWLLRESRTEGMLTVDYVYKKEGEWVEASSRLALTRGGWRIVHGNDIEAVQKQMINAVNRSNAEKKIQNLFNLLEIPDEENFAGYAMVPENRLIPVEGQQSKNEMFSSYVSRRAQVAADLDVVDQKDQKMEKEGKDIDFIVPPPAAIFCPITKRVMRYPVTTPSGRSYEKSAIEDYLHKHGNKDPEGKSVQKNQLVRNIILRQAIERIKESKLDEAKELFNDITFDTEPFKDPVLTQQGFTYSRRNIEEWLASKSMEPQTNIVLHDKTLIPNLAAADFPKQLEDYQKRLEVALAAKNKREEKADLNVGSGAGSSHGFFDEVKEVKMKSPEVVKNLLNNLTPENIKKCSDLSVLIPALIEKIKETSKPIFDRFEIEKRNHGPDTGLAKNLASNIERTQKVLKMIESISKTNVISAKEREFLTAYKNDFTGVAGKPSRTSFMFDRLFELHFENELRMKKPPGGPSA